jgi:quercetin dioxygenase-like cupin family protein
MLIINKNTAEKLPLNLDARLMYKGAKNELILLTLQKDEILPQHDNLFAVTFFIVKGVGLLKINDDIFQIIQGDCIHIEPNNIREWVNTGQEELSILVIKELIA